MAQIEGDDTMMIVILLQLINFTPQTIHQIEYFSHVDTAYASFVPLQKPVRALEKRSKALTRTVYGFLPYWQRSQYNLIRWDLISHVVPFGVEINGNGDIVNHHGWPGLWSGVIDSAHAHGVKVHLAVILFDADAIRQLIRSTSNTANAIASLLNAVNAGGVEGVNIDFEIPYSSDRDYLTNFMQALADTFHNHNLEVTMDLMAVDDEWSDRYDQAALASFLDALMIMSYDYFWPGSENAGPPSPLTGYSYNFTWSLNSYINTTGHPEKIIMGVPYYGYDWPTYDSTPGSRTRGRASAVFYSSAATNANIYGRLWHSYSQTPWYRYNTNGTWHQCWYDDDSSLTLKYQTVNSTAAQGIGIWALTYDATRMELWYALLANFAEPWDPPGEVRSFKIDPLLTRRIRLSWSPTPNAAKYEIFMSTDGHNFIRLTSTYSTSATFGGLDTSLVYYYKIRPINPWHTGNFSKTLAIKPSNRTLPQVLLINGADDSLALLPYTTMLNERNLYFSSATEGMVEDSQVIFQWYRAVIWIAGDVGDSTPALTPASEHIIRDFVNSGGNLLISGSNIAQSLSSTGNPEDSTFLSDVLGIAFVSNEVPHNYSISGILPQFGGTYEFDNGTHGHYDVSDPDGVRAINGSLTSFVFNGVDSTVYGVAGTIKNNHLFFFSIPLETIYPEDSAVSLLHTIFDIFGLTAVNENADIPAENGLLKVPSLTANGVLRLAPTSAGSKVSFKVMDVTGRLLAEGALNGEDVTLRLPHSGIFFVRATDGKVQHTYRVVNVR